MNSRWAASGILGLVIASGVPGFSVPADEALLSLADIKRALERAILVAEREAREPFFLITDVELDLHGAHSETIEGGFGIPVLSATTELEAGTTVSSSDHLHVPFVPSRSVTVGGETEINLRAAIAALKEAFEDSRDEPSLLITRGPIDYNFEWTAVKKAGGGVDLIFVRLGGDTQAELRQSIKISMCYTINRRQCAE